MLRFGIDISVEHRRKRAEQTRIGGSAAAAGKDVAEDLLLLARVIGCQLLVQDERQVRGRPVLGIADDQTVEEGALDVEIPPEEVLQIVFRILDRQFEQIGGRRYSVGNGNVQLPLRTDYLELVFVRHLVQLPRIGVVVVVFEHLAALGQLGREVDLLEIPGVDGRGFGIRQYDVGNQIGGIGRFVLVASDESRCGECEYDAGKYLFHGLSN